MEHSLHMGGFTNQESTLCSSKEERERDLFPVLNKRVQSLRNRGEWNSQVEFAIEHARTGLMVLST